MGVWAVGCSIVGTCITSSTCTMYYSTVVLQAVGLHYIETGTISVE
jgi:hypothetical protein